MNVRLKPVLHAHFFGNSFRQADTPRFSDHWKSGWMEYRRLNKRQKAAHWQHFHEQQAIKSVQQQQQAALRGPPSKPRHVRGFWGMNALRTRATPPPAIMQAATSVQAALSSSTAGSISSMVPPAVPPIASVVPPVTPPVVQPVTQVSGPPAPQLTWMSQEDWQTVVTRRELKAEHKVERPRKAPIARRMPAEWTSSNHAGVCVKRLHTDERAAAAGFDVDSYSAQAVRRAERAQEDPERALLAREAEARRKRVRRIEEGKEDREAMRELARSRDCDATPLEATPDGVRETATDGTPRSAKTAGEKLRQLTQSFYQRLLDPRQYGISHEEIQALSVPCTIWDQGGSDITVTESARIYQTRPAGWVQGKRPLKIFNGKCKLPRDRVMS